MKEQKYTVQFADNDELLGKGLSLEDAVNLMMKSWAAGERRREIYVGYDGLYGTTDRDDWVACLPAMDGLGQLS